MVHVRSHVRGGPRGRVDVDDHDRAYPGEGPLGLRGVVGNGRANRPEDVVRVKRVMTRLGRYPKTEEEPNGYIDRPLDRAIRIYQAERGLRQDGWMAPDGETARALADDLRRPVVSPRRPSTRMQDAQADMRRFANDFEMLGRLGEALGTGDLGFYRARDHLNHYLGNSGKTVKLTREEVEAAGIFKSAEERNRDQFENFTFTATTGKDDVRDKLLSLENGKMTRFSDFF